MRVVETGGFTRAAEAARRCPASSVSRSRRQARPDSASRCSCGPRATSPLTDAKGPRVLRACARGAGRARRSERSRARCCARGVRRGARRDAARSRRAFRRSAVRRVSWRPNTIQKRAHSRRADVHDRAAPSWSAILVDIAVAVRQAVRARRSSPKKLGQQRSLSSTRRRVYLAARGYRRTKAPRSSRSTTSCSARAIGGGTRAGS